MSSDGRGEELCVSVENLRRIPTGTFFYLKDAITRRYPTMDENTHKTKLYFRSKIMVSYLHIFMIYIQCNLVQIVFLTVNEVRVKIKKGGWGGGGYSRARQ